MLDHLWCVNLLMYFLSSTDTVLNTSIHPSKLSYIVLLDCYRRVKRDFLSPLLRIESPIITS